MTMRLNRVHSDVGEVGVGRRRAVVDAITATMIYAHWYILWPYYCLSVAVVSRNGHLDWSAVLRPDCAK